MSACSVGRARWHACGWQVPLEGTWRTNRAGLMMSLDWCKAEVAFRGRKDRF